MRAGELSSPTEPDRCDFSRRPSLRRSATPSLAEAGPKYSASAKTSSAGEHKPSLAFDGLLSTSWAEDAPGQGTGGGKGWISGEMSKWRPSRSGVATSPMEERKACPCRERL